MNTRPADGLHQLSQCGLNAPWAAVRLALGEEAGELEPRLLGPDYAVVAGPHPLRPAPLPRHRTVSPVLQPTAPTTPTPSPATSPTPTPSEPERADAALPIS
ncbi:hypothetical protein ACWD6R_03245 [Streptomyces sp. NPDC005151]